MQDGYPVVPEYQTWLRWSYSGRCPITLRVYTLLGYSGTKPGCASHTRGAGYPPSIYPAGVPMYQTWLFWSYSGREPGTLRAYTLLGYPGTKPGCCGHPRVPGYPQSTYLSEVPRYQTRLVRRTRVDTRVPPGYLPYWATRVANLVVMIILGYVPG